MQHTVFVNSIVNASIGGVIVEASNGSPEGPPLIRFRITQLEAKNIHIGKSYSITIEETS